MQGDLHLNEKKKKKTVTLTWCCAYLMLTVDTQTEMKQ